MSGRSRRAVGTAAAVVCCMAAAASTADAASVWVSSSTVVAGGSSCAQPGYNKVQEGINAAKGGTVNICAGTYTEQVQLTEGGKLTAVSGPGTATLVMPASPVLSSTACDTQGGLQQWDEVSICGGTVSMTGLKVEAEIPLTTCANGLYGIFVGGGGTLKATGDSVNGASTTLNEYKGCQHGVAIEVGSKTPAEVGHATLKGLTVSGYQKNGPTVKSSGSSMSVSNTTIIGEGPSPWIGQNGIEVAFGASSKIKAVTVEKNECELLPICGAEGEQATGVLFYQAASGSSLTSSTIKENDGGAYYSSGSATVPSTPDVTISKNVLASNRYEGIELEEGKAALSTDTINGSGRVGIALYQFGSSLSSSESSATKMKISGQSEAAIKVESDKSGQDKPGKFVITKSTETGNGALLINDSNNFEVIF